MKTVFKPWGKEEWLELNEFYCYKRIYINAGHKTSYQYHNEKYETNFIISGTAEIWLEDDEGVVHKTIMGAGEYFNVSPPKKHRVIALTDLILQEVSTPHVDDIIRIEDDTNRPDGKIITEHQTPAVLILCAGLGTRLKGVSKNTNKVLIPINNKAVLSHIIEKFPTNYDIVIALGYKGDVVREYCLLAHPDRKITFIEVDDYTSSKAGPGYSAVLCKDFLQRPFYFITGDCLLDSEVPGLTHNWIGVTETEFPEKYSTALVREDMVIDFRNKDESGFDHAFIGVAGIKDYETFWTQLENNIGNTGEIVNAFLDVNAYDEMHAKKLLWFDTGNLDDLVKAQKFLDAQPLSLSKDLGEITYKVNGTFLKFFSDSIKLEKLRSRYINLREQAPPDICFGKNFLSYLWIPGSTMYNFVESTEVFERFLEFLSVQLQEPIITSPEHSRRFYQEKTQNRIDMFLRKYGKEYYTNKFTINEITYPSMQDVLGQVEFSSLENNPLYSKFHGDLQFDNILYNGKQFFYIDWREEYGGNIEVGDIYYDLAKMMGGLIVPYNKMKDESNIRLVEAASRISIQLSESPLNDLIDMYVSWLSTHEYDIDKVKLIVALIFLNMSPLHDEKFSKFLWFKSLTMLYELHHNTN